jgi:hypothetical protein
MAHKLNINFTIYTAFDASSAQSLEALAVLKTTGINISHAHYFDANQIEEVLAALRTWFVGTPQEGSPVAFPFVVYEKAYDITDTPAREPVLVHGLSAIQATDWQALVDFKG